MKEFDPADKVILAIDGFNKQQAISFLERCPKIKWVKIGLELFSREGPAVINVFKDMDKKIFLDLDKYLFEHRKELFFEVLFFL